MEAPLKEVSKPEDKAPKVEKVAPIAEVAPAEKAAPIAEVSPTAEKKITEIAPPKTETAPVTVV